MRISKTVRVSVSLMALAGFGAGLMAPGLAETKPAKPLVSSNSLAGNYLAARIAATDNDSESAVAFYRKAIDRDPENVGLKLKAFLNFIGNGDFTDGVTIGNQIAEAGGNMPEIVDLVLSVDDIRKKSWKSAERRLEKDWRSALDRLMAGLVSSWVKFGQGKGKASLAQVDGLEGPAWFDLFVQYHGGLIALADGNTKEAIRRLQTAIDNRPGGQAANETYVRAIEAMIHAQWKAGAKDKAKAMVQEGLKRMPQSPVFEKILADINADKGPVFNLKTAQRGAAEVFLNLGSAINKEGGQQFARIYMQLANTLAPVDDVVQIELAEMYDTQGKLERANALFNSIKDTSPYSRIAQLEAALNLDELEQTEEARAALDKLIESDPDDLVAHLSYGAVLARHEKFGDAAKIYQRMIDRIGTPKRFHWNLFYRQGIAFERTKQWPKAEEAFRQALKLYPNQPSVLNYLGYSWVDKNINLQEGLDMIRKAVELRPNDGYMVDSLGWAYYRLGRVQEAVVELERAVELRPGDPTINDHLGDAYWRANRKLEATFQWQHALALDPPEGDDGRIEDKLANGLDVVEKKELAEKKKADKDG